MKCLPLFCLLIVFVLPASNAAPVQALARVEVVGSVADLPFPVYAHLRDAAGRDYVLVKAPVAELAQSSLDYRVLAEDGGGRDFFLAMSRRLEARRGLTGRFRILHDDGRTLLLNISNSADLERLGNLGFELKRLPSTPMALIPRHPKAALGRLATVTSNSLVGEMMGQVQQTNLYLGLCDLSGVWPAVAGGSYSNVRTRHTSSGLPVRRATEFACDYFKSLGLDTTYHNWSYGGSSGRNVIGVRPGTTTSSEIVVVCGHLDDMPSGAVAPGADDNASGTLGVLEAAARMRRYSFERTIRYVLFTGEEQGLLGSYVYATAAEAAGDDIVGVLNLDMIAWDSNNDGVLSLHTRHTYSPGYEDDLDLAATFTNVVRLYGLSGILAPDLVADGVQYSDHASFWDSGYAALLSNSHFGHSSARRTG